MATMATVPPIVLEYLMDKALEALVSGEEVTFSIHAQNDQCADSCLIHSLA